MKCAMVLTFACGPTGRERDLAYSRWACVDGVWPTVLERQDEEKRPEDRVGRLTGGCPIDGLQLEIIRHRTSLEHHSITPDDLPRIPTMLARLTILFVVIREADHQARNDHGRPVWVHVEVTAKFSDYPTVKIVSENGTDVRERDRATAYIARNAPDTDH